MALLVLEVKVWSSALLVNQHKATKSLSEIDDVVLFYFLFYSIDIIKMLICTYIGKCTTCIHFACYTHSYLLPCLFPIRELVESCGSRTIDGLLGYFHLALKIRSVSSSEKHFSSLYQQSAKGQAHFTFKGNGRLHCDWFIACYAQNRPLINSEAKYNPFEQCPWCIYPFPPLLNKQKWIWTCSKCTFSMHWKPCTEIVKLEPMVLTVLKDWVPRQELRKETSVLESINEFIQATTVSL